jgi:hypothetical protein
MNNCSAHVESIQSAGANGGFDGKFFSLSYISSPQVSIIYKLRTSTAEIMCCCGLRNIKRVRKLSPGAPAYLESTEYVIFRIKLMRKYFSFNVAA